MLDQPQPHPAAGSCCGNQSAVYLKLLPVGCVMEWHQPLHQLGVLISVWFYQTLSLLSLAVWNKGSSVRNAKSPSDWTASMDVHGSHGKNRHKLCRSFLELGLPRCFSLSFCLYLPFFLYVLILHPVQCRSHPIWWVKWWHPSELVYIRALVFSFSSLGNYIFNPHCFSSLISYVYPSTYLKHSLYIICIPTHTWRLGSSPMSPQSLLDLPKFTTSVLLNHLIYVTHLAFILYCLTLVFSDYRHLSYLSINSFLCLSK